jgi:hypothetical protein
MQLLVLYYETLILISFTLHFIQVQPVFSNHLSYVTLFQFQLHKSSVFVIYKKNYDYRLKKTGIQKLTGH